MRKLLALVLALVMTLGLATVGTNAAFTDQTAVDASKYDEAITVLNGMKVFVGDEKGNFNPTQKITRASVAAIIYRIATGDVENKKVDNYVNLASNAFSDINEASWAAGYIGYCYNAGYIKGYNGKFFPNAEVTGYDATAMILRAVGYDQNHEFEGDGYQVRVAAQATQLGMYKTVAAEDLRLPANREAVAQILFDAIQVPTVTWTPALGYNQYNGIAVQNTAANKDNLNPSLGWKNFLLASDSTDADEWGRPTDVWYQENTRNATEYGDNAYGSGDKLYAQFDATPVASYTVATKGCDIVDDTGVDKAFTVPAAQHYVNGVNGADDLQNVRAQTIADSSTAKYGAQGRLIEFYDMGSNVIRMVEIDTYLAKVSSVAAEKKDDRDHITTEAHLVLTVYKSQDANGNAVTETDALKGNDFTAGEYILVYVNDAIGQNMLDANGANVLVNGVAQAGGDNRITIKGVSTAAYAPADSGKVRYLEAASATAAEGKVLAQTKAYFNGEDKRTLAGTDYSPLAAQFNKDDAKTDRDHNYTWYFDQYDNLIGSVQFSTDFQVLKDLLWIRGTGYAQATMIDFSGKENTIIVKALDATVLFDNNGRMIDDIDGSVGAPFQQGWDDQTPVLHDVLEGNMAAQNNRFAWVSTDTRLNGIYNGYAMFRVENLSDGTSKLDGFDFDAMTDAETNARINDNNTTDTADDYQMPFIGYTENATVDLNTSALRNGRTFERNGDDFVNANNGIAVYLNTATKFIVRSGSGTAADPYTYKTYTGTSSLPAFQAGTVDAYWHQPTIGTGANTRLSEYADYVYIKNHDNPNANAHVS